MQLLEFLVSQFNKEHIQEHINTHTLDISGNEIEISLVGHISRSVRVSLFTPIPGSEVNAGYHARDGRGLGVESLPVGLMGNSTITGKEIQGQLLLEIESQDVLNCSLDRSSSPFSKSVLDIVFRFYKSMEPVRFALIFCRYMLTYLQETPRPDAGNFTLFCYPYIKPSFYDRGLIGSRNSRTAQVGP
jgi:hypothetical protein